jgi:UDP-N-acetylmuramoylalanine--D-glutamate ligase
MPARSVLVAGAGVSGGAAARALLAAGADVTVVDRAEPVGAEELRAAGAAVVRELDAVPAGTELVVTSPGWRPDHPLLVAAAAAGIEVIGEVELAWRLQAERGARTPWLALTGTNGKTTTVGMLASILSAAGLRAVAAGNVGLPTVDAVLADPPYDVLAVELSSFQLHWSRSLRPAAAAILNVAPDHLDWHGSMADYVGAKAAIYRGDPVVVFNADDLWAVRIAQASPARRRAGFTLRRPAGDELGVVDEVLVDRAFGPESVESVELARVADVRPPGPHNVQNALAAAALSRAHGVPAGAVGEGLRRYVPGPHRHELVATVAGVSYVDDSKATNPHAAAASLAAHDRVVWIAGGLLKGAPVDDLVATARRRLAGVVLLGADRAVLAEAIARHAPGLPVVEVGRTDDGAMREVVRAAAGMAHPGDTVLLAPAAASMDMFTDYAARGDAFAAAARGLETGTAERGSR